MSKSIALIVCDHGLGHLRRAALMALDLRNKKNSVTLFAKKSSFDRLLKSIPILSDLHIINFVTKTEQNTFKKKLPKIVEWLERLPDLSLYDEVICDNLPEVLSIRSNAIISAQFFWHDVLEVSKDYKDFCEDLLAKHTPKVLGIKKFSMHAVLKQPNFESIQLHKNPLITQALNDKTLSLNRNDLLITGGSTPLLRAELSRIVEKIITLGPGKFDKVHVDPELMKESFPSFIIRADFTPKMFLSLKTAICRPGLGILTDLLTVKVSPYLIYEDFNQEMLFNAHVLKKNGQGIIGMNAFFKNEYDLKL